MPASEELDPQASTELESEPPQEVEIEYGTFTEEELYKAIISELGAQRGQIDQAGENYFDLAFSTRDLAIIERAVQFASANNDLNALLQLGLLWADVSPDDPQPHLMLSFQFLDNGDFDQALSHMARVIDLGAAMDFSVLSARTGRLDSQTRTILIDGLYQLRREYPAQESIRITLVQLLAQNRQQEEAIAELEELKDMTEVTPAMVLMEAQLQQNLENSEEAMRVLRRGLRQFSQEKSLRMAYARMLIQDEQFEAAQNQFTLLMEQDPQDWETLYSIALIDMELENYSSAAQRFIRLIAVDERADESQYYLGLIYEQQGDLALAVEHYRQVRIGTNNFLAAQQQATRFSIQLGELEDAHLWLRQLSRGQPRLEILFITIESAALNQAGHGDEALSLLNDSLNNFPNEADLLFARVLYYDSIQDPDRSEVDLQQIISMQPDDSRALNHLGYMLANQTTRFDEAIELLERAISISPDDPAIIDSLAWAQYKQGSYEDALVNIRRAFAAFPDPEVASHLGEILWAMGRETEAMEVWETALETSPESPIVREAMGRLIPE